MNFTLKYSLLLIYCLISKCLLSQENTTIKTLTIGQQVPPTIWEQIKTESSTELVILDFWSTSCIVCMRSFHKMEQLRQQFSKKLKLVMINPAKGDDYQKLQKINARRKAENKDTFILPNAQSFMNDTVFRKLFGPIIGLPHHVWLKKDGTILYITYGYNATPEHVQAVLNGQYPYMKTKNSLFP